MSKIVEWDVIGAERNRISKSYFSFGDEFGEILLEALVLEDLLPVHFDLATDFLTFYACLTVKNSCMAGCLDIHWVLLLDHISRINVC